MGFRAGGDFEDALKQVLSVSKADLKRGAGSPLRHHELGCLTLRDFSKGEHRGPRTMRSFVSSSRFPQSAVTSNLASQIQIGDHGRRRDGREKPKSLAPKLFVVCSLVPKFFDIRILRGISR